MSEQENPLPRTERQTDRLPIKVVVLDGDGVWIRLVEEELFSRKYAAEHGLDIEELKDFFHSDDYQATLRGETDVLDLMKGKYYHLWKYGLEEGEEALFERWHGSESAINVEPFRTMRKYGQVMWLGTVQNSRRLKYIKETMGADTAFSKIVASCEIGHRKVENGDWQVINNLVQKIESGELTLDDITKLHAVPRQKAEELIGDNYPSLRFFKVLLEDFDGQPSQMLYLDDRLDNIVAARLAGINAHLYDGSRPQPNQELERLLRPGVQVDTEVIDIRL